MDLWWIDPDRIAGSHNPSDDELAALRAEGFSTVISLLDEARQRPRYDIARAVEAGYARHNLPIGDFGAPSGPQFDLFFLFVRDGLREGKILLHCQAGIGRTGTMGAAYWLRRGLALDTAIDRIRAARPGAIESDAQRAALAKLAQRIAEG